MSNVILKIGGAFLGIFGLITLFMSASIILDLFGIREKEGKYVLFIVYANFISSFLYLFASYYFFINNKRATISLFTAVAILTVAYIALIIHIQLGRAFEIRTVKAMLARSFITILFAGISWYYLSRIKMVTPVNRD